MKKRMAQVTDGRTMSALTWFIQCLDTSKKWKDTDLKSQVLPQLKKDRPTRYFFKTATLNISIIIRDNPNSQV